MVVIDLKMKILDCTLRDGGYYNNWDFDVDLINNYLDAMKAAGIDIVELGFRSIRKNGFVGACAFTTDNFIRSLKIPSGITIGVMVNGSELVGGIPQEQVLEALFPDVTENSPVSLVRIACHVHEFEHALPAVKWLKERGYQVGFNLMQVADLKEEKIKALARLASDYPLDVLYFADSMGSMNPEQTAKIVQWFRSEWEGTMGIHTHDNLGLALSNTLRALEEGVTWLDATVTGMGRGPGNARTEELVIEIAARRGNSVNMVPLMRLLSEHFKPMQANYGWGTNPYYYLAGKYGIHPTYIQEMLSDSRYSEEDVLAVIEYLRKQGGAKFSLNTLDSARHFYSEKATGTWSPKEIFLDRDVILLGTGSSVERHRLALEEYIKRNKPVVLALNTAAAINSELIDFRIACHPVRLLADCEAHINLPQPLITPYSMLPEQVRISLKGKKIFDFGMSVQANKFEFSEKSCVLPGSLVIAYALAAITSGKANRILISGFDGYGIGDARTLEVDSIFKDFLKSSGAIDICSLTETQYSVVTTSIYGMN